MGDLLKRLFGLRQPCAPAEAPILPPEPIDRQDTAERIAILARGGFHTEADALDTIVSEYLTPDEIGPEDRRWIEEEVGRAFARKRMEEASWAGTTDVDRLHAAFDDLNAAGIIALHNAGYTRSDGVSDAWEALAQARDEGDAPRGYVFYHGQDVEAAAGGHGLYLAFGAFDGEDATALRIARGIVAAVSRHGLAATWEGDLGTRILLSPLDWRKRSPAG